MTQLVHETLCRMLGMPKAEVEAFAHLSTAAELEQIAALPEATPPSGHTHGDLLAEILDARADRLAGLPKPAALAPHPDSLDPHA